MRLHCFGMSGNSLQHLSPVIKLIAHIPHLLPQILTVFIQTIWLSLRSLAEDRSLRSAWPYNLPWMWSRLKTLEFFADKFFGFHQFLPVFTVLICSTMEYGALCELKLVLLLLIFYLLWQWNTVHGSLRVLPILRLKARAQVMLLFHFNSVNGLAALYHLTHCPLGHLSFPKTSCPPAWSSLLR